MLYCIVRGRIRQHCPDLSRRFQFLSCTLHTMDDDDADYMQGSDDEVCIINLPYRCLSKTGLWLRLFG